MSGSRWIFAGVAGGCCLLTSAAALAAAPRTTAHLSASCAGDTITANVSVHVPRRTTFNVRLLARQSARTAWFAIGRPRRFQSRRGTQTYRFRFDVSAHTAYAYRLRLTRPHHPAYSAPILAASCAPGQQVPEAPMAILLPLSLLATSGLLLLRRSRAA